MKNCKYNVSLNSFYFPSELYEPSFCLLSYIYIYICLFICFPWLLQSYYGLCTWYPDKWHNPESNHHISKASNPKGEESKVKGYHVIVRLWFSRRLICCSQWAKCCKVKLINLPWYDHWIYWSFNWCYQACNSYQHIVDTLNLIVLNMMQFRFQWNQLPCFFC